VFGDVRESEILGNRAYPDLLVRGVITHALNQRKSRRLGYEAHTLVLGVALEIYDRRTRETLFSVAHEQSRLQREAEREVPPVGPRGCLARPGQTDPGRGGGPWWWRVSNPGTREVEVEKVEADGSLRLAAGAGVTPGHESRSWCGRRSN
jgi:hypothetical protein